MRMHVCLLVSLRLRLSRRLIRRIGLILLVRVRMGLALGLCHRLRLRGLGLDLHLRTPGLDLRMRLSWWLCPLRLCLLLHLSW